MAAAKAPAKPAGKKAPARTSASSTEKTKAARSKDAREERAETTAARARRAGAAADRRRKANAKRGPDDAPKDLPDVWRAHWIACRERLVKDGTWQPIVRPLLDQMVRCRHEAEYMRAAAEQEPLVEGSMGQLTDHPGFGRADKAEAQALKIASELLLTPASRRRAHLKDEDDVPDPMEALLGA